MNETGKSLTLVSTPEQEKVSRALLGWLNEFPDKPTRIDYEALPANRPGMALSLIQGVYKTKEYVRGGYLAQCQFKVIYRTQPTSPDARLRAEEMLNALGDWAAARHDFPDIGERKRVTRVTVNARAALFGRLENGDEDYQILMTMDYTSM